MVGIPPMVMTRGWSMTLFQSHYLDYYLVAVLEHKLHFEDLVLVLMEKSPSPELILGMMEDWDPSLPREN